MQPNLTAVKKAADPNRPESAPNSPTNKALPQAPGNAFVVNKPRHRKYFNTGPSGAAPEQKLSNGETNNSQSLRPAKNSAGTPDRKKAELNDLLGLGYDP